MNETAPFTTESYLPDALSPEALNGPRPSARSKEPRFKLVPFDQIELSTGPTYLIKNLIPRCGLIVVWGPPKCGKSFFVFDLAMHIAAGWEYRGHRVKSGPVVYCALEGAEGFRARVVAFRGKWLEDARDAPPFHLMSSPLDLVADQAALLASIRTQLGDSKPVAVVIDTLNRSLAGSESSDEDMAKYVRAADAIRDAFDCAVIVVHHCGHDEKRPRGHLRASRTAAIGCMFAGERAFLSPPTRQARARLAGCEWGASLFLPASPKRVFK